MPRLSAAAQGHLAMVVFAAVVAGSFSVGALVANEVAPTALNAVRFIMAAAVMGALAAAGPGLRREHLRAPWRYLALGVLFSLFFVLMFVGLQTAAPVSISAVFTLTPLMTAGFAWLLLRQRVTPRLLLALVIAAVGAAWVIFEADLVAALAFRIGRGEAIFLAGCACYALYSPLLRKWHRGEPMLSFTLLTFLAGIGVLTAFGHRELIATDWTTLPSLVWIAIAYLAILASAGTFLLLQFASLRLPSAKVMAYTYLTPSAVIPWEIALGNAPPSAAVLPGVAATIVALLLLLKNDPAAGRPA